MTDVEFPAMRREVASALASLADPDYQRRAWIDQEFETPNSYDDLTLVINILHDDTQVLPDPSKRLGTVPAIGSEIDALEALGRPLTAVLDRLSGLRWSEVLLSPWHPWCAGVGASEGRSRLPGWSPIGVARF